MPAKQFPPPSIKNSNWSKVSSDETLYQNESVPGPLNVAVSVEDWLLPILPLFTVVFSSTVPASAHVLSPLDANVMPAGAPRMVA